MPIRAVDIVTNHVLVGTYYDSALEASDSELIERAKQYAIEKCLTSETELEQTSFFIDRNNRI